MSTLLRILLRNSHRASVCSPKTSKKKKKKKDSMFIDVVSGTSLTMHICFQNPSVQMFVILPRFYFPENFISNGKGAPNTWQFGFTKQSNDSLCRRILQFPKSILWIVSIPGASLKRLNCTVHINRPWHRARCQEGIRMSPNLPGSTPTPWWFHLAWCWPWSSGWCLMSMWVYIFSIDICGTPILYQTLH